MTISVIIPALNEEQAVGHVVERARQQDPAEVIVVDNGSSDGTAQAARAAGARVVSEPRRGYGAACLAGARAATGDVLVFIDADGSFEAAEIPAVVAPVVDGRAELVLGSRELLEGAQHAVLPHQRFGNWLAVRLLRLAYGLQVTDLGPFRAIDYDVLFVLRMSEMTYGWPIEMMIKAHRLGYRIVEVPVQYGPRLGGQSKVSGTLKGSVLAGYNIIKVIVRHRPSPLQATARAWEEEWPGAP